MKKTLSVLLALAVLLPLLAACGESKENAETPAGDVSAPTAAEETVPPEETEEAFVGDRVPELDFGGATVTMAGQGTGDAGNNNLDMTVEELTGDVVRDAIYQRTLVMEERFNVSVAEPLMSDYTTISNTVKSMVTAGTTPTTSSSTSLRRPPRTF